MQRELKKEEEVRGKGGGRGGLKVLKIKFNERESERKREIERERHTDRQIDKQAYREIQPLFKYYRAGSLRKISILSSYK